MGADATVVNVDILGNLRSPGDMIELSVEEAAPLVEAGTLELVGESAPADATPAPTGVPAEVLPAEVPPTGEVQPEVPPAAGGVPADVVPEGTPTPTGDSTPASTGSAV